MRAAVGILLIAAACSSGPSTPADITRIPDIEGVVSEATPAGLVVDGRNVPLGAEVYSFTTGSHDPLPITAMKTKFVAIGLDEEGLVEWIASIGIASRGQVYYSGTYSKTVDSRAHFEDGTTLALGEGVEAPAAGTPVTVRIDVATKTITEMRA